MRRAFRSPLADHFSSEISFNSLSAAQKVSPTRVFRTVVPTQAHDKIQQRLVPTRIRNDSSVDTINHRQGLGDAQLDEIRVSFDLVHGYEESVGRVGRGRGGEDGVDGLTDG